MPIVRKNLYVAAGALVLVAAAALGAVAAVKTTPWELTYRLVPSDVTTGMLWNGAYTSQLSQDEIISVVHLLNKLDKSAFSIKVARGGPKPPTGMSIQCGDLEILISLPQTTRGMLVMSFDKTTARSFISKQWYISNVSLMSYIDKLRETTSAEAPEA